MNSTGVLIQRLSPLDHNDVAEVLGNKQSRPGSVVGNIQASAQGGLSEGYKGLLICLRADSESAALRESSDIFMEWLLFGRCRVMGFLDLSHGLDLDLDFPLLLDLCNMITVSFCSVAIVEHVIRLYVISEYTHPGVPTLEQCPQCF